MQTEQSPIQYQFKNFKIQQGANVSFPEIIPTSFITLIVGKPNSGKSSLLCDLITNPDIYHKKFNKIFLVSPTILPNQQFILNSNWCQTLDWKWIHDSIDQLNSQIKIDNPQVLFILDDVIGDLRKSERDPNLCKFIFNRRHLLKNNGVISIIITTQKYIICPPKIRSNLDAIYFFNIIPMDWKKIKQEHLYKSYKLLENCLEDIFKNPYQFLYINLQQYNIYINYNKIIQKY